MYRILWIALSSLLFLGNTYGQSVFYQRDASIFIGKGSSLCIDGNYQTNSNIDSDGIVIVTGDLTNNGTTGIFVNHKGTVLLSGSSDQQISATGSWQFNQLVISKSSGNVVLNSNAQIDSLLNFNGGNLYIDTNQIDLTAYGSLSGENENSRIYATTGVVKANRVITEPYDTTDIAGLGLYVHSPDEAFGVTYITRGHQSITDAGSGSIARWFYITPGNSSPTENVDMRYFDSDGITDESSLQFYTKKPSSLHYFPKGGIANIINNEVVSTFFRNLEEEYITLAPITNNATCNFSDSNYVESVFLVPTYVTEEDTVYFVNLSFPAPDSINNIWNSGDGFSFNTEDVVHPYAEPGNYRASLSVNNGVCIDVSSKFILVDTNTVRHSNNQVLSELINSFVFYPNPIFNELNWVIDFTDVYESNLMLLDVFGRVVFEKHYHQKNINDYRDFSALPSGLYLLKLEVMGRLFTYRVIKL